MSDADPRLFVEVYLSEPVDKIASNPLKYWSYPALIDLHGITRILVDKAGLVGFFADLARVSAPAAREHAAWELVEISTPLPNVATALVRRRFKVNLDHEYLTAMVHYTLRWRIQGWRFYSAIAQSPGEIVPDAIYLKAGQR